MSRDKTKTPQITIIRQQIPNQLKIPSPNQTKTLLRAIKLSPQIIKLPVLITTQLSLQIIKLPVLIITQLTPLIIKLPVLIITQLTPLIIRPRQLKIAQQTQTKLKLRISHKQITRLRTRPMKLTKIKPILNHRQPRIST